MVFARAGARVLIVDRDERAGCDALAELRALAPAAEFLCLDLSSHEKLASIIEHAVRSFGRLDILVNAAQSAQLSMLAETSDAAMRIAFDTGFWPTFILMRAAYPHLVKTRGCVINFASGAAFAATPKQGSYIAAKEAIRAMSKVAANEWGPQGVRVNIVCPLADSEGVKTWKAIAPGEYDTLVSQIPLRRMGDCEQDIGEAVAFLACDAARYITGHTLMIDGGQTKTL
jgi:NAD(P)-dependent dehydrogenase (short-subunit alcohol dehydrogenase family)